MKISFSLEKNGNQVSLLVAGNLTAQSAMDFRDQLQLLYAEKGNLHLSLKNTDMMDVSSLQLVKVFKQYVALTHRDLQIIPPDSAELVNLLAKTGLFSVVQS